MRVPARFDVTRAEFTAFATATNVRSDSKCDWRDPKAHGQSIGQHPDEPVVCIAWDDAKAYAAWLSSRTGSLYRLPSEAEWEYAARAGSASARPWGETVSRDHANYGADTCCGGARSGSDRWLYTSPVGSFPPNAWGLSDMLGNVWQWTADCAQDYVHTPNDGSPARDGDCNRRMLRGGAWFQAPESERSAARANDDQKFRAADIGFRVARDLAH